MTIVGGLSWDAAAFVATLGPIWGVIAHLLSQRQLRRFKEDDRETSARDEWRSSFVWAVELIRSESNADRDIGAALVDNLSGARWVTKDDREVAVRVMKGFTSAG